MSSRSIHLTERSENPRAEACLRAEHRAGCKFEALTSSMFSGDLKGQGTPVLSLVVLAVCLNVVTHVAMDLRSGTGPNGTTLKAFPKARWAAITEHPFEKKVSTQTNVPRCSNG